MGEERSLRDQSARATSTAISLRVDFLTQIAKWATLVVPPLGAFFGHRLAATCESAGVNSPVDPNSVCQRCETILRLDVNCSPCTSTKHSSGVYACHYCGYHNPRSDKTKAVTPKSNSNRRVVEGSTSVESSKKRQRKSWLSLKQLAAESPAERPSSLKRRKSKMVGETFGEPVKFVLDTKAADQKIVDNGTDPLATPVTGTQPLPADNGTPLAAENGTPVSENGVQEQMSEEQHDEALPENVNVCMEVVEDAEAKKNLETPVVEGDAEIKQSKDVSNLVITENESDKDPMDTEPVISIVMEEVITVKETVSMELPEKPTELQEISTEIQVSEMCIELQTSNVTTEKVEEALESSHSSAVAVHVETDTETVMEEQPVNVSDSELLPEAQPESVASLSEAVPEAEALAAEPEAAAVAEALAAEPEAAALASEAAPEAAHEEVTEVTPEAVPEAVLTETVVVPVTVLSVPVVPEEVLKAVVEHTIEGRVAEEDADIKKKAVGLRKSFIRSFWNARRLQSARHVLQMKAMNQLLQNSMSKSMAGLEEERRKVRHAMKGVSVNLKSLRRDFQVMKKGLFKHIDRIERNNRQRARRVQPAIAVKLPEEELVAANPTSAAVKDVFESKDDGGYDGGGIGDDAHGIGIGDGDGDGDDDHGIGIGDGDDGDGDGDEENTPEKRESKGRLGVSETSMKIKKKRGRGGMMRLRVGHLCKLGRFWIGLPLNKL